jgi:phenylpropionate dioxygenase-like ring-hydroxylating dioxygenase large terminal subunit
MLLSAEPVFRRFWYPVALEAALDGGPVARRVLGTDLVLWRTGPASVAAAVDRCPHRDARLSAGWLNGCEIVCPYHGWTYGADGKSTHIPQLGAGSPLPPTARLASVASALRYGVAWVCLEPPALAPLPAIPEYGRAGWRVIPEYEWEFDCSAAHLIENNFDPAHVAFVHRNTFGSTARPEVAVPEVEPAWYGLEVRTRVPVEGRHGQDGQTERITTSELHLPFLGLIRIGYQDGLVHLMFKGCCPVDDGKTRLVQFVVRNDTESDVPAADILAFDHRVEAEDQAVLATVPADLPLDLTANVHLRTDRTSIELRRLYRRLVGGEWRPSPPSGALDLDAPAPLSGATGDRALVMPRSEATVGEWIPSAGR